MAARKESSSRSRTKAKGMRSGRKRPGGSPPAYRPHKYKRFSSDRPVVVYIHGIGSKPSGEDLKLQWDLAAFGKDMGDATRMAYWADILHGKPDLKRTRKGARAEAGEAQLDAVTILKEAGLDPENKRAVRFIEHLAASLAPSGGEPPPRQGEVKKGLPLPRPMRRPVAEAFLRTFLKDAASYFFDANIREGIKARLIQEIPEDGEPFILVAHSLGSVVAFEVLSELAKHTGATLFATLGSPLGIREVQDVLEEDGFELRVPPRVSAWHNFSDRRDIVAIDPYLNQDFEPCGDVEICDHLVAHVRAGGRKWSDRHSSLGYLANLVFRTVLHRAFGYDPGSRFVVARDVVERFAAVERRQPVLIEVLRPKYRAADEEEKSMKRREKKQAPSLRELPGRIENLAEKIKSELSDRARAIGLADAEVDGVLKAARVLPLRKYVAAHLTPDEIAWLARNHAELNVYAVWRSAEKRKMILRSGCPIKVDAARTSYCASGKAIVWAVLDTGVRWDHPHFKEHNTILEVLDCTTDSDKPEPIRDREKGDPDGHGTHVAGVIAGEFKWKQKHYCGMAPQTQLLVYKVLDDGGFGEDSWIIKAIDDIYRRNDTGTGLRVHGVNLSLGGSFDATVYGCGDSPICKDLRDLWRQGVLVCVAAGNEGQIRVLTADGEFDLNTQVSVGDPANLEDCIAVGSVHADNPYLYGTSYFSSRGPTADGRAKPDVVAPGERIESCDSHFRRLKGNRFRDMYREDSGTSMACPHVSGMLAAFLSVRREFIGFPDKVKRILLENCNDIGRDRYHQGAGLPNLMKMLLNT